MANEEHLKILKQGVEAWNRWREEYPDIVPDLTEEDMRGENLSFANLSHAELSGSDLRFAKLEHADLSGSALWEVDFLGANLNGANLSDACLGITVFVDTDLRGATNLALCSHQASSIVDYRTLQQSGMLSVEFLRGCGLPDSLIDFLPELLSKQYHSCFISYSTDDQEFVDKLYADLQGKGVRCWLYTEHMRTGDKIRPTLDEAIRGRDKLLLVLSENSISSAWVEKEVETAFEEERKRRTTVLFPIRLDDAVMGTDEAWAAAIRTRHIGDFREWKDSVAYRTSLERLLRDLKAPASTSP